MGNLGSFPVKERIDLADEPDFALGEMKVLPPNLAVAMNGDRRELQPRVMQVLVALAKTRPAVVSRDRLVDLCWNGRVVGDDAVNRCVLALRHLAQEFAPPPFAIETVARVGHRLVERSAQVEPAEGPTRRTKPSIIAALSVLAVLLAVGLLLMRPWAIGARPSTVVVTAVANDAASRDLADDLVAKLGSFEAARSASMRLFDADGASGRPDLILEVGRGDAASAGARLVLKSGSDHSILWSDELKQPSGKLADLKPQVAFTAARVLRCATEALAEPLKPHTLKTYLSGCAALLAEKGDEAELVIPMFRTVLKDAPTFKAAWGKLLAADANAYSATGTIQAASRLKADLAAARKATQNLPEAYLAQIVLLPTNAYAERMRLANRLIELNPENSAAFAIRSHALQLVGRMWESVVDARRAMQLDPLSPDARNSYVRALGAAGHYEAARQELQEAERLWPGAISVAQTRFAFNLRFGDPEQAWEYLRAEPSANWMNGQSYLEARSDRTAAKIDKALKDAQALYRAHRAAIQHLIQVYGEFDRERELLQLLLRAPHANALLDLTFRAPVVDFWEDPRSLLVAKRAGLLDYWRTSGEWPDFCFATDLPYDCKAEAAKIRA
jgi:DNA-binding winged helix-turn-helix (wHTH) protein/tetratricopeptide (TPR) repeat protein